MAEEVVLTFPKGYYKDIQASITVPAYFEAPVQRGDAMGTIELSLADEVIYSGAVVALAAVEEAGLLSRFGDYIHLMFDQPDADE